MGIIFGLAFADPPMPIERSGLISLTVEGRDSYNIHPTLFADHPSKGGWEIGLVFKAATGELPRYSWFRVTNRFAAKIELRTTNGVAFPPKTNSVLEILSAPKTVVTEEYFANYRRLNRRPSLWVGSAIAVSFNLDEAFDASDLANAILKVTPFLYKVHTTGGQADLLEFPSIELKLDATKSK